MKKLLVLVFTCGALYFLYIRYLDYQSESKGYPPSSWKPDATPLVPLHFDTAAQAEQSAERRFPALAVTGSGFNREFTTRYNNYKTSYPNYFSDTSWPVRLAIVVAESAPSAPDRDSAEALEDAKTAPPISLQAGDAFSLAELEDAKAVAQAEKKPLGFIMVWGQFFGQQPLGTRDTGSDSAMSHFYEAFHNTLVLVFVRHESELGKVPRAVHMGFGGPDEGGFAPNMAVTDATATEFIVEIPMGGGDTPGTKRDQVFADGAAKIQQWLSTHRNAVTTPSLMDRILHPGTSG